MTTSKAADWEGHGPAHYSAPNVSPHASLFDSPMSEIFEDIGYGDEADLDDLFRDVFLSGAAQPDIDLGSFSTDLGDLGVMDSFAPLSQEGLSMDPGFDFNFNLDPNTFIPFLPQGVNSGLQDLSLGYAAPGAPPSDFSGPIHPWYGVPSSHPSDTSSSSPTTMSPGSSNGSEASSGRLYPCPFDGCYKAFSKETQLKQHRRVHRKKLVCHLCPHVHRFAQVRDLERHMHARHKEEAARAQLRSEDRRCPFDGCDYHGRRDNVSRHYELKHGGKLQWRGGVPTVLA